MQVVYTSWEACLLPFLSSEENDPVQQLRVKVARRDSMRNNPEQEKGTGLEEERGEYGTGTAITPAGILAPLQVLCFHPS